MTTVYELGYFLREKYETSFKFQNFKAKVENESGDLIKTLRTIQGDNFFLLNSLLFAWNVKFAGISQQDTHPIKMVLWRERKGLLLR